MNGGYTLVDCTGIELTTLTKQTVSGIRKKVETAYKANKPVYACGITYKDTIATPIQVMLTVDGDDIIGTASVLQLYVDKSDGVTIVNLAPANRTTKSK